MHKAQASVLVSGLKKSDWCIPTVASASLSLYVLPTALSDWVPSYTTGNAQ